MLPTPVSSTITPSCSGAPEHEGGAEDRVAGEGQLEVRREDPDPTVPPLSGGNTKTRFAQPQLERERLHRRLVELAGVGEDRELVPGEGRVGEDVGDDVAECAHGGSVRRGSERGGDVAHREVGLDVAARLLPLRQLDVLVLERLVRDPGSAGG